MQHRVASRISIGVAVPPPDFANTHKFAREDVITTQFTREGVDVDDTVPVELYSQPYERVEIAVAPAPMPQRRLELDSRAYERLDIDYEIDIDLDLGPATETKLATATGIENEIDTVNETKDDLELAIEYGLDDANPSYFAASEPDANQIYIAATENDPDANPSYELDANLSYITATKSEPDANPRYELDANSKYEPAANASYFATSEPDANASYFAASDSESDSNPSYFAASAADAARPSTALRLVLAFSMLGAAFGLGLGLAFLVAS